MSTTGEFLHELIGLADEAQAVHRSVDSELRMLRYVIIQAQKATRRRKLRDAEMLECLDALKRQIDRVHAARGIK